MTHRTCAWCDAPLDRNDVRYCHIEHARLAQLERNIAARAALVEDVAWLVDNGETAEAICTRLGYTPRALSRRLYRASSTDLGAYIARYEKRTRPTHPCADCGEPCTRGAERCQPCGYAIAGRKRAQLRWAS